MKSHYFKNVKPCGSVDYLLRTIQQNLITLSSMADKKANIIITVSSIILTLLASNHNQTTLKWSFIAMGFFGLLSLSLAIYAVIPAPTVKIAPKIKGDILFFPNIAHMTLDDYQKEMGAVMEDPSQIYARITKSIYDHSMGLTYRKYKYVRYSFLCLLLGVFFTTIELVLSLGPKF